MHLICILKAEVHRICDSLIDAPHDFVDKFLVCDAHRRVNKLPREAAITFTFPLPDIFLAPVMQLLEELEEENTQVFSLFFRAKVNSRNYAL